MKATRILIMGAAGRDFHDFNVVFRDDPSVEVVAFTAAQIPHIAERVYPSVLAGPRYPRGIPIHPESELEALIERERIDQVIFAYSDVSHEEVMHKASQVLARGADFRLLGPNATMLPAVKPVVSVCAVRTGCGKSPVARRVADHLLEAGLKVAVVRHPMPYGDLEKQAVQRFASLQDLRRADCTVEEMEEYEPHIARGHIVYAGVDYARILRLAEAEADAIVWDGGNNDLPFFIPDLEIVLVDPHRVGHERNWHPGEANLLRADVVVINKVDTAPIGALVELRASVRAANPRAQVMEGSMPATIDTPERVAGARVLVIEDGPTLTHGGMRYGAGALAAQRLGARELVDPRPFAVGSIARVFAEHGHLGPVLPAMGYSADQVGELGETVRRTPCDLVLIATPVDLRRVVAIRQPVARLTYEFQSLGKPDLNEILADLVAAGEAARRGAEAKRQGVARTDPSLS